MVQSNLGNLQTAGNKLVFENCIQCLNTKTFYYPSVRAFKPPLCGLRKKKKKKKSVHGYITFPRGVGKESVRKKLFGSLGLKTETQAMVSVRQCKTASCREAEICARLAMST